MYKVGVIACLLLLYMLSSEPFAGLLIKPIEYKYPFQLHPETHPEASHILVLGGGYLTNASIAASSMLSSGSLGRLTEGIRIKKINPDCQLIFSGGNTFDSSATEADIYAAAYIQLTGDSNFIKNKPAFNTKQESKNIAALLGAKPFFLVTSASHMPRAMLIFKKAGCNPIPCPCDYNLVQKDKILFAAPNSGSLHRSEIAILESIGLLWFWITE